MGFGGRRENMAAAAAGSGRRGPSAQARRPAAARAGRSPSLTRRGRPRAPPAPREEPAPGGCPEPASSPHGALPEPRGSPPPAPPAPRRRLPARRLPAAPAGWGGPGRAAAPPDMAAAALVRRRAGAKRPLREGEGRGLRAGGGPQLSPSIASAAAAGSSFRLTGCSSTALPLALCDTDHKVQLLRDAFSRARPALRSLNCWNSSVVFCLPIKR